jgi:phospholipase C
MSILQSWCLIVCIVLLASLALGTGTYSVAASKLNGITHLVVIYQENWSFDSLYGKFPGANGIANARAAARQVDKNGQPYRVLPQPLDTRKTPHAPDPRFPASLPNGPFDLAEFVQPLESTGDLVHDFYPEQYQIDGGKMDKFVAWSDAAGLAMSYYDATDWPVGRLAQQFVLADNFFHAAFGDSFLNHQWLICACTPRWPNAPASIRVQLDAHGLLIKDGQVTSDGYVVTESYTVNSPHPAYITDRNLLLPNQTQPTIGDRLTDKGISWAWYAGGWNDATAGHPDPQFKFHHQPFAYFAKYAEGTPGRAQHLRDEEDFYEDLKSGRLPAVTFVKFIGDDNEHPANTNPMRGQRHVADLVRAIMESPFWPETAVIIAYDENGGRWDHMAPPKGDRWGPGTRVPAIIVSPLAKPRYIDHTVYDTTSILKTIEVRWNLQPLGTRDAAANDLGNAFR